MGIMDEDEYGAGVFAGGAEARPAGIFDADPGRHSVVDDHVMAAIHAHAAAGGGDAAVLLHDPADDDIDDFDDHVRACLGLLIFLFCFWVLVLGFFFFSYPFLSFAITPSPPL